MRSPLSKQRRSLKIAKKFQAGAILFIFFLVLLAVLGNAVLVYVTSSQELSKSFFSAHKDYRTLGQGLLPAILVISTAVFLAAFAVGLVGFFRLKAALERTGQNLFSDLERLGRGEFKGKIDADRAGHLGPLAHTTEESLESLRQHIQEVKNISLELHRGVMRLNYYAFEEGQIKLTDLKNLSSNLNTLSRELTNALKWFEV